MFSNSSGRLKPPCRSLKARMLSARAGPIPGSVMSSSRPATFRLTRPVGGETGALSGDRTGPQGEMGSDALEHRRADARDATQVRRSRVGPVSASLFNDSEALCRPDSWQPLQLLRRRGVGVDPLPGAERSLRDGPPGQRIGHRTPRLAEGRELPARVRRGPAELGAAGRDGHTDGRPKQDKERSHSQGSPLGTVQVENVASSFVALRVRLDGRKGVGVGGSLRRSSGLQSPVSATEGHAYICH
jgi:hypothetical protein